MALQSRGFTLTELMVSLALLSILLAAGLPAIASVIERVRVINAFNALTTSLMAARMAAIVRGAPVTVCPSSDGRHCRNAPIWDDGWLVYVDPGRRDQPMDTTAILQHVSDPASGMTIRSTQGRHRVRYQPSGWSGGNNLTIRVCIGRPPKHAGDVVVNLAGRPRTRRPEGPPVACPTAP